MEFESLLKIVGDEPVFETGLLLAGNIDQNDVRRQLSRWTKTGRIIQLRRGLYTLATPYQKVRPHPFTVANRMVRGSYVSCQSAMAYFGIIPEYVPTTISVSASRPAKWTTKLGNFTFRHIKSEFLFGYSQEELGDGQRAFVATPEKALLDLIYLTPGGDRDPYLHELRLQNLGQLNLSELNELASRSGRPKLKRAAENITILAKDSEIGWSSG
jgi:predicted transcriptional regulator of viral defense system